MPSGLTISEAARAWGVHRDSVKRWIKTRAVEAVKDNQGVWRIAEGQQPPPSAARVQPQDGPGEGSPGAAQVPPGGRPGVDLSGRVVELTAALALAEKDLAVSRRENELLHGRMAELREELTASKADRERLLDVVAVQARTLKDRRGSPRGVSGVGVVGAVRRWLFGERRESIAAADTPSRPEGPQIASR